MPNGEAHEDQPKSKASRSVKTPLQKEALEAAYSSKPSRHQTSETACNVALSDFKLPSIALHGSAC